MGISELVKESKFSINHSQVGHGAVFDILQRHAVETKRPYNTTRFVGTLKASYKELLATLENIGKMVKVEYDSDLIPNDVVLLTEEGIISVEYKVIKGYVSIYVASLNLEDLGLVKSLVGPILDPKQPNSGDVHMIARMRDGTYGLNFLGRISCDFVPDNYDSRTAKAFDFIRTQLEADNPLGRLVLLHGAPGTGKSYFIRSLVCSMKNTNTVLIPPSLLGALTGPELVECITDLNVGDGPGKRNLLIFEDSDSALVKRDNIKSSNIGLSDMLNMSDGLIGELADLRMLCTTNTGNIEIDPAIKRPGRLCANVEFKLLEPKQASRIYRRLTGEDKTYHEEVSLSEVYMSSKKLDFSMLEDEKKSQAPVGGNFI